MYLNDSSNVDDRARVAKLRGLAFGPPVEAAQIHFNLPFGCQFDVRTVHRTRSGAFEIDTLGIVPRAVAGALEFVLTGFPIRRAAEVRADRGDHENALGVAHHPDAVRILKLGIHAETEIGRVADQKLRFWLVERPWEEEAQEHEQIHGQKTEDARHYEAAAARDDPLRIGIFVRKDFFQGIRYVRFGFAPGRRCAWGSLDGRISHVSLRTQGASGLPSREFWTSECRIMRKNQEAGAAGFVI